MTELIIAMIKLSVKDYINPYVWGGNREYQLRQKHGKRKIKQKAKLFLTSQIFLDLCIPVGLDGSLIRRKLALKR